MVASRNCGSCSLTSQATLQQISKMYLSRQRQPPAPNPQSKLIRNERRKYMKLRNVAALVTLSTIFSLPVSLAAQEYALLHQVSQSTHDRAEREQTEKDH